MGELGTLKNGMNFSKEAMGVGFPFVNLQNIFGNNVINANDLGLAMASEAQLKDYNLLEGDVLFVRSSVKLEGVGEAALVPISLENTTYSGFIIRFRDKYGLDKNFKRFIFCIDSIRSRIMSQATNSANKNISQFVLKNLDLKIPCKNEQVKIGEYFSNLDCLITLHQRKIIFYAHFYTIVWEQRKLEDYLYVSSQKNKEEKYGKEDVLSVSGDYGIVNQIEFQGRSFAGVSVANYGVVEKGDIVYTKSPLKANPYGIIKTNKGKTGIVSTLYVVYKPNKNTNSEFVQVYFEQDARMNSYMHPLVNKGAKNDMKVSAKNALQGNVIFPKIQEQKQISIYFKTLDHLITLHQWKCRFLVENEVNDWEQRKLFDIANKVTEKNKNNEFSEPFTNSAEQGIVSQREYFDREIVNNENLDGYYIVRNNDFIYNPRISVTAPVGPINRNRLGRNGVMSPLYTIFRTHNIDNLFLEFYFKTTSWHRYMKLNGDSGARFDRFTISSVQFMKMPIPYPMLAEQKKIGEYLDNLDHLITLHQWKCLIYVKIEIYDKNHRKLIKIVIIFEFILVFIFAFMLIHIRMLYFSIRYILLRFTGVINVIMVVKIIVLIVIIGDDVYGRIRIDN